MKLGSLPFAKVGLALVVGSLGGFFFTFLHLPLAWMLGAMVATAFCALLGVPIAAPVGLRPAMKGVIGTMLGASLTLELLSRAGEWGVPLLGLLLTSAAGATASYLTLRRFAGLDRVTAYFGAMPGGLVEMAILGDENGGDQKAIALIHTVRVFAVVLLLPVILAAFVDLGAYRPGLQSNDTPGVIDSNAVLWFAACLIVGMFLGQGLRLPAGHLLGPLLLSGGAHLLGWTSFKIPFELIAGAQVVLGVNIGARFIGANWRSLATLAGTSFATMIMHLALGILTAMVVASLSGFSLVTLVLAYSPGGLTEMSLIAVAIGGKVGFVALHHLVRVVGVLAISPIIFRYRMWPVTRTRDGGP